MRRGRHRFGQARILPRAGKDSIGKTLFGMMNSERRFGVQLATVLTATTVALPGTAFSTVVVSNTWKYCGGVL